MSLISPDVVPSALHVPVVCWFHPSDCLVSTVGGRPGLHSGRSDCLDNLLGNMTSEPSEVRLYQAQLLTVLSVD